MLCSKDQKGPVTALEDVDGYLLSCIGQKVIIVTIATAINIMLFNRSTCGTSKIIKILSVWHSLTLNCTFTQ